MKPKYSIVSIFIILSFLFLGPFSEVNALPGSNWATGIKLQNLSSTTDANISIKLRYTDGTDAASITTTSTGNPLVALASSSVEVYLPSYSSLPDSQFSAEISSNVPLGVVATMTNYDYGIADSYNSMNPAKNISIPAVYHDHNFYYTEIMLQNTTDVAVTGNIILTETPGAASNSDGSASKTVPFSIPAYGVTSINTSDISFDDLNWFIGSGIITSTGNVVAVSNQVRLVGTGDTKGNILIQSRGLTNDDAGDYIVIPSLYKNFSGASGTWNSGIKIVNPSTTNSVTAQVTFTSDPDNPTFSGVKSISIPASGNVELYLAATTLDGGSAIPDMFKGSAIINVDDSKTVVATIQHTNYLAADGYGVALGYTGFSSGYSKVSLPSLYRWPSGAGIWISGIKVQNLGTDSVTVTINLKADPDVSTWTGTKSNVNLEPGEAYELYLGSNGNLDGGLSVPEPWKGSALVTASGTGDVRIAATVLHTNYGRHVANMYTGIGNDQ